MRTFVFALIAALAIASAYAADDDVPCDPNGNNIPDCSTIKTDSGPEYFRNFWDPVHYWACPQGGGAAVKIACPESELYDSVKQKCVSWIDWEWIPPCSNATQNALKA